MGTVGAVQLEGDEGEVGARRTLLIGEADRARGCPEVQAAARKFEHVVGGCIRGQRAHFPRGVVRLRSRGLALCFGNGAAADPGDSGQGQCASPVNAARAHR